MEKATRLTKVNYFDMIIELAIANEREDIQKFAQHEKELLLNKKANGSLTATQKENENIKKIIVEELEKIDKPVTITELINSSDKLGGYTNPKITALCTQLLKINVLDRIPDKKKAYYTIKK